MKTTEALKALDKKIARVMEEQKAEREILTQLPDDLEFRVLSVHGFKSADGSLHLEVKTRKDIPALLEKFPPVPLAYVKSGSVSIQPLETTTDEVREKAQSFEEICPWIFQVERVSVEYPTKSSVRWYTKIGWRRLQITAEIERDEVDLVPNFTGTTDHSKISSWTPRNLPTGKRISWWAGTNDRGAVPNNITIYWPLGSYETITEALVKDDWMG